MESSDRTLNRSRQSSRIFGRNRISESAQSSTSADEQTQAVLDTPVVPDATLKL